MQPLPQHYVRRGSLDLNFRLPNPKIYANLEDQDLEDLNNYFERRPDLQEIQKLRRQQVRPRPSRSPLRTVHQPLEPLEFAPDGYEQAYAGVPRRHFSPIFWTKKCLPACLTKPRREE
jgi:hypothetical protein